MLARLVTLVALAAPAAFADRALAVDEAMVTVEHGARKARTAGVSIDLRGALTESGDAVSGRLVLPAASFHTGTAARDEKLQALTGEVVLDVQSAPAEGNGRLRGTLTFHGVSRPIEVAVAVTRSGPQLWAHASFTLALRSFGAELPDEPLTIEVDAGFRPPPATLASR